MSSWTYEKIYESGGRDDPGFVRVGDLVFYSGGFIEAGSVMFPPGVAIDVVHGAIHLKRIAGSRQLKVVAGSEVHVFEFRTIRLWCTRWVRFKPVSINPSGDIDAQELPSLPLRIKAKEVLVSAVVLAVMLYCLLCFVSSTTGKLP